jgi:hypothetical protein
MLEPYTRGISQQKQIRKVSPLLAYTLDFGNALRSQVSRHRQNQNAAALEE